MLVRSGAIGLQQEPCNQVTLCALNATAFEERAILAGHTGMAIRMARVA